MVVRVGWLFIGSKWRYLGYFLGQRCSGLWTSGAGVLKRKPFIICETSMKPKKWTFKNRSSPNRSRMIDEAEMRS